MRHSYVIGTRGSELALWQAGMVRSRFSAAFPDATFEVKIIRTTGDQAQEIALSKVGDKGLFTRQIEAELLDGSIHFAVHSLKDLQTEQPDGLVIGAICEREVPNDLLISREYNSIDDLPEGARVATGSLRRRSQLLHRRPDLEIVEIRGNVPTRLDKFINSDLEGLILAYAGVFRLGLLERYNCSVIPVDVMLPAVGQGAVAVEIRADDVDASAIARKLEHTETAACVTAERAFLRRLEGGCQVPIGGFAEIKEEELVLNGVVGSLDGREMHTDAIRGPADAAEQIGEDLANRLIGRGADRLLAESRHQAERSAGVVL